MRVFVFDVRAEAGAYGGPDYVSRRVASEDHGRGVGR